MSDNIKDSKFPFILPDGTTIDIWIDWDRFQAELTFTNKNNPLYYLYNTDKKEISNIPNKVIQ